MHIYNDVFQKWNQYDDGQYSSVGDKVSYVSWVTAAKRARKKTKCLTIIETILTWPNIAWPHPDKYFVDRFRRREFSLIGPVPQGWSIANCKMAELAGISTCIQPPSSQ